MYGLTTAPWNRDPGKFQFLKSFFYLFDENRPSVTETKFLLVTTHTVFSLEL